MLRNRGPFLVMGYRRSVDHPGRRTSIVARAWSLEEALRLAHTHRSVPRGFVWIAQAYAAASGRPPEHQRLCRWCKLALRDPPRHRPTCVLRSGSNARPLVDRMEDRNGLDSTADRARGRRPRALSH